MIKLKHAKAYKSSIKR